MVAGSVRVRRVVAFGLRHSGYVPAASISALRTSSRITDVIVGTPGSGTTDFVGPRSTRRPWAAGGDGLRSPASRRAPGASGLPRALRPKLMEYVLLDSGAYSPVSHGSLYEVKVGVAWAQVLDQRVVVVGPVADEFGDQSQFQGDRGDSVLAERYVDVVLPGAATDALEGVGVRGSFDGAGAHVDVVDREVGEVLPGVR